MPELRCGDKVVCVNDQPVAVQYCCGTQHQYDCGLTLGLVYEITRIDPPAEEGGEQSVWVEGAINPLSLLGFGGSPGYSPQRFSRACEPATVDLAKVLSATGRGNVT